MPRRREVPKREILPDPKFGNVELSKFMNVIMEGGKKAVAERIIYGALEQIEKKTGKDPVEAFSTAINNVKPMVEVKSRRVGGANYQVPVEVRPVRRATDAAGLDFHHGLDVVDGSAERLDRVFAGLLFDLLKGTVNDALGDGFLAAFHDHVHELGELDVAELGIRQNFTFRDFATTWHFFTSKICFS